MKVEVKLFAYFRDNRFSKTVMDLESGVSVGDVTRSLGIKSDEIGVTMINGRHCNLDTVLKEDDSLGVFPMIGGG